MAKSKGVTKEVRPRTTGEEREKVLAATTGEIEKRFGKGAIMRFGDDGPSLEVEAIPHRLARPRRRARHRRRAARPHHRDLRPRVLGQDHALARDSRRGAGHGGVVAFIDAEHALDPGYAARIGVDIDEVLISQPDYGEQALEICDMLVRSGAIDVVVVDSVAALTPRAEIEGEIGDSTVGLQARLMSQALRKLAGSLAKSNTTCIFINQLREKIGVMFGNPETTPGGRGP